MRAVALGFVALSIVTTGATTVGAAKAKPEIDVLVTGLIQSSLASYPHQVDGAKAAAAAILKKDGVKINISSCNDGMDPNLAAACARQAVTDKVDAVTGGLSTNSAALYPTLEAAKIGFFGPTAIVDADYASTVAFPFTSGLPGGAMGYAETAKKRGCKSVGVLASDAAATVAIADSLMEAIKKVGLTGSDTTVPATTADYAPFVAQALSNNPDCLVVTVPTAGRAILAIRQSSKPTIPVIAAGGVLNKQLRDALGPGALDGSTGVSQYILSDDPTMTRFRAEMAAYSSDQSLVDDPALLGWANVYAVYQASQNVKGALSSASLLAAANKTTFDLDPYPKPIDFAAKSPVKSLPRLRNTTLNIYNIEGGQAVSDGTVDVRKLMSQILSQ